MKRILLSLFALLLIAGTAQAAELQAGKHYRALKEPVAGGVEEGQVEVREFFSYMCPHCYDFRPVFHDWLEQEAPEQVKVERTPMVFHPSWKPLAQAYYVAELLDVVERVHKPLFEAIHVKGRKFQDADALAAFFAEHGVDRGEFMKAWDSFAVDVKMRRGEQLARQYGVMSTPSLGVAGRYFIDTRTAGGKEPMLQIAEQLVKRHISAQ